MAFLNKHTGKQEKLVHTKTGKEVNIGDTVTDFRGETGILTDALPHSGMNGHVYVDDCRCYPSVIGCKFVEM